MPKVHVVEKARKDYPNQGISKGDKYFWWKFNFQKNVHRSKTHPKRSQLTRSGFLSSLYSLQDDWEFDTEDLGSSRGELVNEIQNLLEECESSLENMPEHLKETSDSGVLLQERIDALQEWIDCLEAVDCDIELDEEELTEEELEEKREERVQEILNDLDACECSL